MRPAVDLLGTYQAGGSVWHRLGVGWKYLVLLGLTLPGLVVQQPWCTGLGLLMTALCLAGAGLPGRVSFALPWSLVLLLAMLAGFQLLTGQPELAVVVPGNLLLAVLAARLLLCTTPPTALLDALVGVAGRLPGVDGERFGLAVGLMLRSIPFLAGAFYDVRDAARSRGLERHWVARTSPVVIRAVGYAQATGAALAARGLGEPGAGEPGVDPQPGPE